MSLESSDITQTVAAASARGMGGHHDDYISEDRILLVSVNSVSPKYFGSSGGETINVTLDICATCPSRQLSPRDITIYFNGISIKAGTFWGGFRETVSFKAPQVVPTSSVSIKASCGGVHSETFNGPSAYSLRDFNPSFGIQSFEIIKGRGTYLPACSGKIMLSLHDSTTDPPTFLSKTSNIEQTPSPTSADFCFYLPRGLDKNVAYNVWYCPEGNKVASLIPTPLEPLKVKSIGPLAASITATQQFHISGEFPKEITSKKITVRFSLSDDSQKFVDSTATWKNHTTLVVSLKANSFLDVCDLHASIIIEDDPHGHIIMDHQTKDRALVSLYRLGPITNMLLPSNIGGSFFVTIFNLTTSLTKLTPCAKIGSVVVKGQCQNNGALGAGISGALFAAPSMTSGQYKVQFRFDDETITWDTVSGDCDSIVYYNPLPYTNAQAFGVKFSTTPAPATTIDSKNDDQLVSVKCFSQTRDAITSIDLFDGATPLQILNLTGSSRLCNGDPVAIRVQHSGIWKCLRLRRYPAAFSLDPPPMPDALVVDTGHASTEYPNCRESLFGIWRIETDDGKSTVDQSPHSEIRLGYDRVLIVGQAYIHNIDPALVSINYPQTPETYETNNFEVYDTGITAPILDLDLNTPVGIGNDFLTSSSTTFGAIQISTSFRVPIIDCFLDFSLVPSIPYSIAPGAKDTIRAKSTSSLVIDSSTMYMFATDIIGGNSNTIYYGIYSNGSMSSWMPLLDTASSPVCLNSKGNIRAVAYSSTRLFLFQQTQATGLLKVIVVSRSPRDNKLSLAQDTKTFTLIKGFTSMEASAGAPIFLSKFTVLLDKPSNHWHFFTVPANESSAVAHIRYSTLAQEPFIDVDSGKLMGWYGQRVSTSQSNRVYRFIGLRGGIISVPVSQISWGGAKPVCITGVATSDSTIQFKRYGGNTVSASTTSSDCQNFTLPALDQPSNTVEPLDADDKLLVTFDVDSHGSSYKTGDQWILQIMPVSIDQLTPSNTTQADLTLSWTFSSDSPKSATSLTITLRNLFHSTSSSGVKSVQGNFQCDWSDGTNTSTKNVSFTAKDSPTQVSLRWGIVITIPAIPQSYGEKYDDGTIIPSLNDGDSWKTTFRPAFAAIECISQPPAASFVDSSQKTAYIATATHHGAGVILFMKVNLESATLTDYRLSQLRTVQEFQIHTTSSNSILVFRGVKTADMSWSNGIYSDLGSYEDARQCILYPRLGGKYRKAHLGQLYAVCMEDQSLGFSSSSGNPTVVTVTSSLEPSLLHKSVIRIVPPGYSTVGCVDILGAGYTVGADLSSTGSLFKVLSLCSVSNSHIPSDIFAPAFIYNINHDGLLAIKSNVRDSLLKDVTAQLPAGTKPFADGSPIWDVKPILSENDYGNEYSNWQPLFKWLLQLNIAYCMVKQGADWPSVIHHKVVFLFDGADTYRASGTDFWSLRMSLDRQSRLTDIAMRFRAFKYRYSVHLREEIKRAFPDLEEFTKFGGIGNVTGVSLCHPSTMAQMAKLDREDVIKMLGDCVAELRYLDANTYSQVLSHYSSWAISMAGTTLNRSSSSVTNDNAHGKPNSNPYQYQSDISRLIHNLGPFVVFGTGGLISYKIYSSGAIRRSAARIYEIMAQKGPMDAVREYNRLAESLRSWGIDGDSPRVMPSDEADVADATKIDDMVVRDGADFMEKVREKPDLIKNVPELKEHVSAVEKEMSKAGRVGVAAEGAFAAMATLYVIGNWDHLDLPSKILNIGGVACIGGKTLGMLVGSRFPSLVKAARAGLRELGAKLGATVGENFMAGAAGRFVASAGRSIALKGLKFLGPIGNIVFAVEGIRNAVKDFEDGKILDGALELASSAAMLGAALCELLVLAGVTAAEGIGEVLMAIVVIIMIYEVLKDPQGVLTAVKDLWDSFVGNESEADKAIDAFIVKLKNWALATTLSVKVNYDVSAHDADPRIVKNDA